LLGRWDWPDPRQPEGYRVLRDLRREKLAESRGFLSLGYSMLNRDGPERVVELLDQRRVNEVNDPWSRDRKAQGLPRLGERWMVSGQW
jgi:hypothetical protein